MCCISVIPSMKVLILQLASCRQTAAQKSARLQIGMGASLHRTHCLFLYLRYYHAQITVVCEHLTVFKTRYSSSQQLGEVGQYYYPHFTAGELNHREIQ